MAKLGRALGRIEAAADELAGAAAKLPAMPAVLRTI